MAKLDLRLDRPTQGDDLRLGVVARVRQVKDLSGAYPDEPVEREVVIPAGTTEIKTLDDLPFGTYRIDARLPSGEVLRKTRELSPDRQSARAVFKTVDAPRAWLGLQRLAGNVPSQAEYEDWVGQFADQVNELAKARLNASKPIEIDPATISWAARMLRSSHLKLEPFLRELTNRIGKLSGGIIGTATVSKGLAGAVGAPAVEAPKPLEFEIVTAVPLPGEPMWQAVASMTAWTAWRGGTETDAALDVARVDDRQLTLWRITQHDRSRRITGPSGRRMPMRSFAATQRGEGVDVMALPVPWPMNSSAPPARLEILREAGVSDAGRTTLTVCDDLVGSLILYLGKGQMSDAATILAEAGSTDLIDDLITEKLDNPFAACAAGYVGIATMASSPTAPRWTGWLDNLMDTFEWLPDGAVVRATHLLKTAKDRADLDLAREAFKTAFRRGIPFYAVGMQQLMNGLYSFSEQDDEAKAMYDTVSRVASRVDITQAFTQIMIGAAST